MLQSMRHLAQSWFFKGLMLILMVSFGIWGIGDIFRSNPLQSKMATVGDVSISQQDFQREYDHSFAQARQMFGGDLTQQQARQMGMPDQVLTSMTQRAAFDQEIDRLGINLNDKALLDQIAAQPQFRDKNGNFNITLFRQLLKHEGLDESRFFADGRKELMRNQIIGVFQTENPPPDLMLDALYKARGQKRIFTIATLRNDTITSIATPDDKTLRDYYQNNPTPFTAPEYRSITIARLSGDDILKAITITDEQLHKTYEAKLPDLAQPERRDFIQVIMQDQTKAGLLAIAARQSGNLTGAAKEKGYDAIPINRVDEKGLPPELGKAVFAMKPNEISEPVHTSLGWHVVQLTAITPAGKPSFDEVKDQLRDTMRHDQAVEATTHAVNQLDDQLAAGHALEDIADELKLRLIKIPALDAQGKTPDGKDPAELPNKDDVMKAAFGQNAGETSPIIDDRTGNYVVVRTDDVTAAAVKPFDQVHTAVAAAWKSAEQAKQAAAKAEKIATDMRANKADLAAEGVTLKTSKPVSLLGDNDPELPVTLLPQLLKLGKGEVTIAALADRQLIVRLERYEDVGQPDAAAKGKLATAARDASPKELTSEYIHYLQNIFPAKINQNALDNFRQIGG